MNKRNFVRYGSELLPGSLSKVTISWEGHASIGSFVVDYGPQGLSLVIPPMLSPVEIPQEAATVKVLMPIDQTWFTGQCVYARNETDGSVSMGVHFSDPKEQTLLKDLLFTSLNAPGDAHSFVSYEWEELVGKLCESEDPQLQKIGCHHRAIIKQKQDRPNSFTP
jgi:hypothetical protein